MISWTLPLVIVLFPQEKDDCWESLLIMIVPKLVEILYKDKKKKKALIVDHN